MSEEEIPEPIKVYENYVTTNNKVYGVTKDGFEEIADITNLFKIDGVIYFTVGEKNYSQDNGVVVEIELSDFPEVPDCKYIEFEHESFKIESDKYKDTDISNVYNKTLRIAYLKVDSVCLRGNDMLFAVSPHDTSARAEGIYIWTVSSSSPRSLFDSGRIW